MAELGRSTVFLTDSLSSSSFACSQFWRVFCHTFEIVVAITPPHAQNSAIAMPCMRDCKSEHLCKDLFVLI